MALAIIILAAGNGTRMKSAKPKVLHRLAGRTLLGHVLHCVEEIPHALCAVVHQKNHLELLKSTLLTESPASSQLLWVEQSEQLGTGHAVSMAIAALKERLTRELITQVLILNGDVPLIDKQDIQKLLEITNEKPQQLGLLTLEAKNPYGLGRIIRDNNNNLIDIVEEKDATNQQRALCEVNTGIFLLPYPVVTKVLKNIKTENSQGEYYLTDIIKLALLEHIDILTATVSNQENYAGVNNLAQLASAERYYQSSKAKELLHKGVNIIDPDRIDIRGTFTCDLDCVIDVNCIFEGDVSLGKNCLIEAGCILKNVKLGDNVHVKSYSLIENSIINNDCIIGPFARIRPNTLLENKVHIGNFVEVKSSIVAQGSKVNHLSYIGDSTIGKNVNIGAGTITCNYDGVKKHQTIIGDNAFIGSNTSLIAPISVGSNATIGAGSTVSKNVPEGKLTVARGKQTTIENWNRTSDKSQSIKSSES